MTYDQLMTIMRECAGTGDAVTEGPDDIDTSFEDLGYDSLALLETTGRIQQLTGITLPDDLIARDLVTPRLLLDAVNTHAALTPDHHA